MGNYYSGFYYDHIVAGRPFDKRRREMYDYAYFFDDPDSIVYKSGYQTTDQNTIRKAAFRATLERPVDYKSTRKEKFIYLTSLPEELLCDCIFQQQAKIFWSDPYIENSYVHGKYDEDIVSWALDYKGINECQI